MLSIQYFFPDFWEGWKEAGEEEKQRKAELAKEQEVERPYVDLRAKLNGLSNFEDITFLSCPPLEVIQAAQCGYSPQLAKADRQHCGAGYTQGQRLDKYYFVFGRNNSDQTYQKHVAVRVNPVTGNLSSHLAETKDYKSSPENKSLSTYWLDIGLDTLELNRESLKLMNVSSRVIRVAAKDYGIDQFFPLEIPYRYAASATCEMVDGTLPRFEERLVAEAKSLKQQYELAEAKRSREQEEKQAAEEAEALSRNKL